MSMRERTLYDNTTVEGLEQLFTYYTGVLHDPWNSTTQVVPSTGDSYVLTSVMHDVVTPNYKRRIRDGEIINNPMDSQLVVTNHMCPVYHHFAHLHHYTYDEDGDWFRGQRRQGQKMIDIGPLLCAAPSINVDSLIDQAIVSARANLEQSQAAILATLGEGKETILGLVSIFRRLIKFCRKARKLRLKEYLPALKGSVSPKDIANEWMELRYGIRPLIYDTNQIIEAFKAQAIEKRRITSRGYAEDSATDSAVATVNNSGDSDLSHSYFYGETERKVEVRGGVLAVVESLSPFSIWGLDDPVEAVWELVPFSFIIDWFFNVGDTISALTPESGVKRLASWVSVKDVTIQKLSLQGTDIECRWNDPLHESDCYELTFDLRNDGPSASRITTNKSRVPNPLPVLLPSFTVKLNPAKLVDLLIIAKQIWRRR